MINRNFSLLWAGQLVSQIGNRLYLMALAWYFVNMLGDNQGLFVLFIISSLPYLLFGAFIGPLVERCDKKRLVIASDLINGVLVSLLVVTMRSGSVGSEAIFVICFLLNTVAMFFSPAVNSIMPDIVPQSSLQKGMAYIKMITFIGQIVGAALGGVLVGVMGVWLTIIANAVSFFLSAIAQMFISYKPSVQPKKEAYAKQMVEGWRYMLDSETIKRVTLLSMASNLFVPVIILYIPIIIKSELGLDAIHYGLADAMIPLGAIMVSAWLSRRATTLKPLLTLSLGIAGVAACSIGMSLLRNYFVMLAVLFLYGIFTNYINVSTITYLVRTVDANQRGRFFSLMESFSYASFSAAYAIGAMIQGHVGTVYALAANAIGLAVIAMIGIGLNKK